MKSSKGFTLIELLVVIAIIGILSSVVLASLNTARAKGSNAAIKSQLAAIRPQAEIYYDTYGNYGSSTVVTTQAMTSAGCPSNTASMFVFDATISNQLKSVFNTAGAGQCMLTGSGANTAWAVAATLKVAEGSNTSWCVDSSGASKGQIGNTFTSGLCQ